MPSLRRTLSSPSVRSSPYPTAISSSSSSSSSSSGIAQGNGRRRASTETGSRRVLADIDWWTVTAGQLDESGDQNQTDVVATASLGVDLFSEDAWSDIELPALTRQSSLTSTPEIAELALPIVHHPGPAKDTIFGLGIGHPSTRPLPLRPVRAHSFADVFSLHAPGGPYADFAISPLSPGLDFRN
ncbi:hypothetical protein BD779DRAFT_1468891 [Infundibulicybe gibba]|nr:hypothetical protein BD779DRAFT_1468891 [Infundibulicybe gibba]